jgi:hypothetical protein
MSVQLNPAKMRKFFAGMQAAIQIDIPKAVAPAVAELIRESFAAGKSAEGKKFKPLKDKSGRTPLEALQDRVIARPFDGKIKVTMPKHVLYHQEGNENLPQRNVLPKGPMPARWQKAINRAIKEELTYLMKKAMR